MGIHRQLRGVEHELIKDLRKTSVPFLQLAEKYGVSRQAISVFCGKKGIKRPKREHTEKCSICQGLIRIAKKPHSDFISSQTIREQLRLERATIRYHIRILRGQGLVSQKFGRLQSRRAERAYQIYFKKRIPIGTIGRLVGFKNFYSVIKKHKDLGWDVPASLFTYDSNDRREAVLRRIKTRRGGAGMDKRQTLDVYPLEIRKGRRGRG